MSYLRGFAPWIAFSVVSSFSWQWGALVAAVLSVTSMLINRRAGMTLDGQILDLGSGLFFAALAALAFLSPDSPVQNFAGPLASTWLGMIALVSLVIRRPFTLGIARRRVSPEIGNSAAFRHLNMVITTAWTIGFLVSGSVGFACQALHGGALLHAGYQLLGFVVPMVFTRWYTARIKARRAQDATPELAAA